MNIHASRPGLFLVSFDIGYDASGGPRFTANMNIHSSGEKISGFGWITQPSHSSETRPAINVATRLEGNYQLLGALSNAPQITIEAIGYPVIDWLPQATVNVALKPDIRLRLVLDACWKKGSAHYQYRTGTFDGLNNWIEVKDVPVTATNAVPLDSAA